MPTEGSLRIGLLTVGDSSSVQLWSGTPYFLGEALARHVGTVVRLGPLHAPGAGLLKGYGKLRERLGGRRILPTHARPVTAMLAAHARRLVSAADPDVLVLLAASSAVDGVPNDRPMVYVSDATFRRIQDYYPRYTRLSSRARHEAERLEQAAIARADLRLYASAWAASSAIEDYGADPATTHVVPFGANIGPVPEPAGDRRAPAPWRLLFVGVDWAQKGARIAVDALDALRARGVDAELTICGCTPPEPLARPGVTVVPFLDKRDPADRQKLTALYGSADLFIMPTRAECYGVVFCEAAAYGLPSIGTATGGTPSAVREGESGHLLPPEATGSDYAELIAAIVHDSSRYAALRRSSRAAFERHLNWNTWGSQAAHLMAGILETSARRRAKASRR